MEKIYIKFAEQMLETKGFNIQDFKNAMIFANKKNHYTDNKFPNVIFCGYVRDGSEEERSGFADGSSTDDDATIYATTYWIIDDEYIICDVEKEYEFVCSGHSGGVEYGTVKKENVNVHKWLGKTKYSSTKKIIDMIENFTSYIALSSYDHTCQKDLEGVGFKKQLIKILEKNDLIDVVPTKKN